MYVHMTHMYLCMCMFMYVNTYAYVYATSYHMYIYMISYAKWVVQISSTNHPPLVAAAHVYTISFFFLAESVRGNRCACIRSSTRFDNNSQITTFRQQSEGTENVGPTGVEAAHGCLHHAWELGAGGASRRVESMKCLHCYEQCTYFICNHQNLSKQSISVFYGLSKTMPRAVFPIMF